MILSILSLSIKDIISKKLVDEYSIHKLVYTLFPGDKRTFLYYEVEQILNSKKIIILSETHPKNKDNLDISSIKLSTDFLSHSRYLFKVRLNPVIKKSRSKTLEPVLGVKKLSEWFINKQSKWGFVVEEDTLLIDNLGLLEIQKNNQTKSIKYNKADFSGVIAISDFELFSKAFKKGIGRGKAFGFGLLQLQVIEKEGEY